MVSIRFYWFGVLLRETNHLFDQLAPVNFGQEIIGADAQSLGNVIYLHQVNSQGTILDLGNGAAGGVIPARKLQFIGEYILRPRVLVAFASDQPTDEIPLLHVQTTQILIFAATPLPNFLDKMAFSLIFHSNPYPLFPFWNKILAIFYQDWFH